MEVTWNEEPSDEAWTRAAEYMRLAGGQAWGKQQLHKDKVEHKYDLADPVESRTFWAMLLKEKCAADEFLCVDLCRASHTDAYQVDPAEEINGPLDPIIVVRPDPMHPGPVIIADGTKRMMIAWSKQFTGDNEDLQNYRVPVFIL